MSTTKHTPTPWTLAGDGESIIQTHHVTRDVWTIPHSEGDMARIVQCVNACADDGPVMKALKSADRLAAALERERMGTATAPMTRQEVDQTTRDMRAYLLDALRALGG